MRRFTRTPHYSGPDDPEIGQVRGTLALGETVIIETIGGADNDFEAAGETRAGMITSGESHRRYARPGGPFLIEGIGPDDWVAIEIVEMEVGPYGFYRNGGPNWGNWRCVAPVRDGLILLSAGFCRTSAADDRRCPTRIVGTQRHRSRRQHGFQCHPARQHRPHPRAKARGIALVWAMSMRAWAMAS